MREFKVNIRIFTLLIALLLVGSLSFSMLLKKNPKMFSSQNTKTEVQEGMEVEDDNWELSIVFYDSAVDNGTTPLTEVNWHAADRSEQRVIKVQINYKNTNVQKDYDPNKLEIEVDRFRGHMAGKYSHGLYPESVSAGTLANGYDWNGSVLTYNNNPIYRFYNNVTIEKNSNFEGSIQMVYSFKPTVELGNIYNYPNINTIYGNIFVNDIPEKIQAHLRYSGKEIDSNEITLNFNADKQEYSVIKSIQKVKSLDGLANADQYIWVKYGAEVERIGNKPRPAHRLYFVEEVPEGAVAYNEDLEPLEVVDNKISFYYEDDDYPEIWGDGNTDLYIIGYPKETFTDEVITSTVKLYGTYIDDDEPSYLAENTKSVNLSEYEFVYDGELYKVTKGSANVPTARVKINGTYIYPTVTPKIVYTGTNYDLIISDDFMIFPMDDGTVRMLEESEYSYKSVYISGNKGLENGNGGRITGKTVDIYVRYANTTEFVEYPKKIILGERETVNFGENEDIKEVKVIINDLNTGIGTGGVSFSIFLNIPDVAISNSIYRYGYNFAYMQVRQNGEIVNTPTADSYRTLNGRDLIDLSQYDLDHYGTYMQRAVGSISLIPNTVSYMAAKDVKSVTDYPNEEMFKIKTSFYDSFSFHSGYSENMKGSELYDLLPEGMDILSTEEDILASIEEKFAHTYNSRKFKLSSGTTFENGADFWEYYKEHISIEIIKNYNNTNRTLIRATTDFSDDPLYVSPNITPYAYPDMGFDAYLYVTYNSYFEYGSLWENKLYAFVTDQANLDYRFQINYADSYKGIDTGDINGNGITDEMYFVDTEKTTIYSAIESHQDVQTSVQTEQSNFATGKVTTAKDSEYTYKLRVRTGQSDVTNLVIYDSIEDYAKNSNLEIIKASQGKPSWQGELLSIDTSYAESKGYTIKVYYNENPNSGSLTSDNTWQEYTDTTDKSIIKAVAFKYLDSDGNPAVLPANTNTYVLLKMKSPNADYKTFTYNGSWTEWNAIDSVTGRPVDFITGINSNIVKVALPTSVEPSDINITLKKVWNDKYNTLGLRPNSVNFKIIANDDYANATEVPLSGSGNEWTTQIAVPNYDDYGEIINYIIREETIDLGNGYKYIPTVDNYTITNTLNKDITLTKVWKDNTNAYLTRPSSVTFKVKQNGNDYKTVTFGGTLTTNTWSETITVPVYSSNGNEYNYTIEEVAVENYSSSCTNYTCTNTLTGNENITVKKVWEDNSNTYSTRPNSIDIRLKQNNNAYQTINLTGTTNTWTSDGITVPKYDSNGVKYTYTIEETQVADYGQVTYDQANLKVTNTLKKNISITITKKWVDDSNALGLRPTSLTITLLQNGNDYQNVTLTGNTDTWTSTIEVPKYDNNQEEYTYTIKEVINNVNEDYSNISYSQEELSVTNTLEKKTNLTISKIWDDGDNELLTRPESITINLLRNGTLFQELEIIPDNISDNTWSTTVENVDVYDRNGAKYTYTIEENLEEQLERYETITYDQTTLTITNKLTLPPKVTLYFTVKNGYSLPGNDDILYDEEGYNDVLSHYDLNGEDEYIFNFELENVDTGEIIEGKLSTQGTLEFDDVPYGTYRAREGVDKYFDFVSMIEIEEVLGVTFTQDEMGGTITISPTGKDIVYGAQITNKIEIPVKNPETKTTNNIIYIAIIALLINAFIGLKLYNKYAFLK